MWLFGGKDSPPEPPVATGIHEPQERTQDNNLDASDQIAVVGMSMRLPGGIKTAEDFWDLLIRGKDCHGPVPASRYNADNYYCESGRPGTLPTKHGYFLDDDLSAFDASFFSMNGTDAATMDPKLRFLLEVVWECLENGGQVGCQGKDIGCFVGNFGDDWSEILWKDTQSIGKYHAVGTHNFSLANRISYEYDFHGPSTTVDTACASSLMALHQACQALRNNECSGAIVGGTSMIICHSCTASMGVAGALSRDGRCKTFDASADGYGRAEAISSIFVKRLPDAIRDGDPIRATIRSTATNFDGRTPVFIAPNPKAHEDMIKMAYKSAGIDNMGETGFYECHGTGTQLGDRCQ
ncbi:beta-ketoacyl [acyl carrier protein] synthase domain-containing protein [Aspergillus melleus]|uniref:beta-ketoacyl [acyl carrier protein] synthase domain-containing protein n=1 Tax=Aspergillus melleus TaxID=138277 RepID=UPI001E8D1E04|nr:uncharacterized protein LDX57_000134 [Aspergillus melleus]KAH8422378.1 hypothetical protein LDX57_000134 [Aspergillus melleus]